MTNRYDSPQEESAPPLTLSEVHRRHGRGGVESADFIRIGFMMQVIGGALLLVGVLLAFLHWALGGIAIVGAMPFIPGRGLAVYKPWAWRAAVMIALPLTLFVSLCVTFLAANSPISLALLLFPMMSAWICWVLLSHGGRDRYRLLSQAASKRKSRATQPQEHPGIEPELFASEPAAEPLPNVDPFADLGDDR